jgi:hypothetical protein
MIRRVVLLLPCVAVLTLLSLAGCGSDENDEAVEFPASTPEIVRGGAAPQYVEPVLLVPGKYESPAGDPAAQEAGLAAYEAQKSLPRFEGVRGNFRLYRSDVRPEASFIKIWCGGGEIVDFPLVERLTYEYLPPGTYALSPQSASICEDGSTQQVQQAFATFNSTFDIHFQAGERAFPQEATADRITDEMVADRPAVVIKPLTSEGFGRSHVAMETEKGFIMVDARDLPLNEAMKIAEGVKCADC